ncbi:tautomerase family protein [Brucella cytisi]|uniref:Tautomerase family protein n=1 Tax=Brucella cytisi TaxID=407152 RepID=A0A1J6HX62_9HYPH|nr:tautomerase family protein [Brucella cytisi]OIS92815.1 tautomerase family protein [Brucella cytisi]
MPILQVSMQVGKPAAYRKAILDSLYQSLRDVLHVPEGDKFMTITEHEPENFCFGSAFDVRRTSDLLYISITLFDTRTTDHKARLFRRMVVLLSESPGVRPEDVFINIYEAPKENWSVGNGEMHFGSGKAAHG